MKLNLKEFNNELRNLLLKENCYVKIGSSEPHNIITFTFDLLNPKHSPKEIWNNVCNIFDEYPVFIIHECERIDNNIIRITYKIDEKDVIQ